MNMTVILCFANDDTIAADIAGNNADNNDNATVLPSIAFAEKAGRPDPNSDIRLNPERERAFNQHRHA